MVYQYAVNIGAISDLENIQGLMDKISEERKQKIERYYFLKDKLRCLFAEALLRFALWERFNLEGEKIKFEYSKYGKPFLKEEKSVFFNISHSGDWVVCSVGNSAIGTDVEKIKKNKLPMSHTCFSKKEIDILKSLPLEEQTDLFYRIWTLKESFVKYIGKGLSYPLDSFSFSFKNQNIRLINKETENPYICFYSNKLDNMHWYALCVNREEYLKLSNIKIVTAADLISGPIFSCG